MTDTKWSWTTNDMHGKIYKLYYAYSLDHTPPVYVLFAQMMNGDIKKVSELNQKSFENKTDRIALAEAKLRPQESPLPVPEPPKQRGDSCSIT